MHTKRAIVTAIFSLCHPGVGHIFQGKALRGLSVVAAVYLVVLVAGLARLLSNFWGFACLLVLLACMSLALLADSIVLARRPNLEPKAYSRWWLCIIFGGVLAAGSYAFFSARERVLGYGYGGIPSGAMSPTLLVGDFVLYDTAAYQTAGSFRRGDVIVFRFPLDHSVSYVKRIIGTGGDTIAIVRGKVTVNGQLSAETYLPSDLAAGTEEFGPVRVPEGKLFVLGDNRPRSADSRVWGFVDASEVRGRVTYIAWAAAWNRIGRRVR
jgi:signal peptidase I